jgi:hypothetical protein
MSVGRQVSRWGQVLHELLSLLLSSSNARWGRAWWQRQRQQQVARS